MRGVILCKYYSHTATTEWKSLRFFSTFGWKLPPSLLFQEKPALHLNAASFSLMNEIYAAHLMCDDVCVSVCSWRRQETFTRGPSHPGNRLLPPRAPLPPRQPGLRNRSLFKSFMSTSQKRKACRKLRERNEEYAIVPLICHDLWHNGCNWFHNHSLFPFRREGKLKSAILPVFLSFPFFCFTDECLFFFSSPRPSMYFSFSHPMNMLLNSNTMKNSPHWRPRCASPSIWWTGGESLDTTSVL